MPLGAQGGKAGQKTKEGRNSTTQRKSEPEGKAYSLNQQGGTVSPYAKEGAVGQIKLPRVSQDQIQSQRGDRPDAAHHHDVLRIFPGNDNRGDEQESNQKEIKKFFRHPPLEHSLMALPKKSGWLDGQNED